MRNDPEALNECLTAFEYYNTGVRFRREGRVVEAIGAFTTALELDPSLVSAYYNRGNAYEALGNYALAIADFKRAVRLDPSHFKAWCNLGGLLALAGQVNEALSCLDKAAELGDAKAKEIAASVRFAAKNKSTGS